MKKIGVAISAICMALLSSCAAMAGAVGGPAAEQAARQSRAMRGQQRVVVHASSELLRLVPSHARVWVHNGATGREHGPTSWIVDDLVSALLQNGIEPVDRESAELIAREQDIQLSGDVRDSDIIGIGNRVGATHLAIVNIIAAGNMRRLQMRMLEIETGRLLLQSDTSDTWRIQ